MNLIQVDAATCGRDGMCAAVCPLESIEIGEDGLPREAAGAQCIACGHCVAVCPRGALSNVNVDGAELQPVLRSLPDEKAVRGLMLSRRSIRAFKDTPVEAGALAGLLDTARYAPTAVNSQNVSWIACADAEKTRQAAGLAVDWLRGSAVGTRYAVFVDAWEQGRDLVMRGAPAFVAALTPTEYTWGAEDATIALTYLELAAASAGLGVCWAGLLTRAAQNHKPLADFLGVPEGMAVRGGLMIGYAKFRYAMVPPRKDAVVRWM